MRNVLQSLVQTPIPQSRSVAASPPGIFRYAQGPGEEIPVECGFLVSEADRPIPVLY